MSSASFAPASGVADLPARKSIQPERMLESSMRSADMGWRVPCMMSTHSQTSTQLPEKRPRGSSMVVSRAAVRVPASSPVSTMSSGEIFRCFVGGHEGAGADFDVEDEARGGLRRASCS